mgnify:CR=1 FL=1
MKKYRPWRIKNLTGIKFGRLFVIEQNGRSKNEKILWKCLCDCGNTVTVVGDSLKNGVSISCGCFQKEEMSKRRSKNLDNKKFGNLIPLKIIGKDKFGNNKWDCLCDCGNKLSVTANNLLNGSVSSCGCLHESLIANQLKNYFIKSYNAIPEYKIFRNPDTNSFLPFDIYIPPKFFIEVNGKQHYDFNSHFYKTYKEFEYRKMTDILKKEYAEKTGTYIEIDLRKVNTTEKAIAIIKTKMGDCFVNSERTYK